MRVTAVTLDKKMDSCMLPQEGATMPRVMFRQPHRLATTFDVALLHLVARQQAARHEKVTWAQWRSVVVERPGT